MKARWLIAAEGFLGQKVAGGLIGSRSAAAANLSEFTCTAFAVQVVEVAQGEKDVGSVPDLDKRCLGDVTAVYVQKTAGLHDPDMRDETKPRTSQASPGKRIHTMCFKRDGFPFFF